MGKILVRNFITIMMLLFPLDSPTEQCPEGSKNVPVGKIIALLAEEGDDISNLEAPKEELSTPKAEAASAPTPSTTSQSPPDPAQPESASAKSHPGKHPSHSRPFFPSVHRLLLENDVSNVENVKGTGIRGMLTKGDVLAFLGQASSPTGTYKEADKKESTVETKKPEPKVFLYSFCPTRCLTPRYQIA
jgi:pyruvate/2-oxoglutarate dehydrogenase complex dihydrolipoamide acyltransferase (E2) component